MTSVWVILKSWQEDGDDLVMVCSKRMYAEMWTRRLRRRDRRIFKRESKLSHKYVIKRFDLNQERFE